MEKIEIRIPEGCEVKTDIIDGILALEFVKIDNEKSFDDKVLESIHSLVENGKGWFINSDSSITKVPTDEVISIGDLNICTKQEAKSDLMHNKLRQLSKHPDYNGDWEKGDDDYSFFLFKSNNKIYASEDSRKHSGRLEFKTAEICDKFTQFVGDDQIKLALSY